MNTHRINGELFCEVSNDGLRLVLEKCDVFSVELTTERSIVVALIPGGAQLVTCDHDNECVISLDHTTLKDLRDELDKLIQLHTKYTVFEGESTND